MKGKIRFGMVGTGFIADWVLAGARQDARFEAAAICSRNQAAADAFAAKHGIPHTFTSLEEMARSPLVDAVYIASPNALHASQSILCMSCGKHVLCEKPLASNAREARAMIEAARRYGVVLMEAMIATLNPNFRIVREQLPRHPGVLRTHHIGLAQRLKRAQRHIAQVPNGRRHDDEFSRSVGRFHYSTTSVISTSTEAAMASGSSGAPSRATARAARASASFSARFALATAIMSLMRLSWFTSLAPGS